MRASVADVLSLNSTTNMSVEISTSAQLGFPRPLTQVVKRSLFLTNSNPQPVAFKVKTTAPKQYCVRPNSGRLEAGERVEVQVLLQPLKEEPPMQTKCRDKFLIQSAVITPDKETVPIADFWVQQEAQKDAIAEHKIRCVYLPPSSETVPEENEDLSNVSGTGAGAPTYGSFGGASAGVPSGPGLGELGAAGGVGAGAGYLASRSTGAEPPISIASLNNPDLAQKYTSSTTPSSYPFSTSQQKPTPAVAADKSAAAASPAAAPLPHSTQELEAEVLRLRAQVAAQSNTGASKSTATVTSSGVPVHIVAAIAVGVFAVTYLFF